MHPRVKGSFLDSHSLGQSSIACYLPNLNISTGLFLAAKSLIRALFDLASIPGREEKGGLIYFVCAYAK